MFLTLNPPGCLLIELQPLHFPISTVQRLFYQCTSFPHNPVFCPTLSLFYILICFISTLISLCLYFRYFPFSPISIYLKNVPFLSPFILKFETFFFFFFFPAFRPSDGWLSVTLILCTRLTSYSQASGQQPGLVRFLAFLLAFESQTIRFTGLRKLLDTSFSAIT